MTDVSFNTHILLTAWLRRRKLNASLHPLNFDSSLWGILHLSCLLPTLHSFKKTIFIKVVSKKGLPNCSVADDIFDKWTWSTCTMSSDMARKGETSVSRENERKHSPDRLTLYSPGPFDFVIIFVSIHRRFPFWASSLMHKDLWERGSGNRDRGSLRSLMQTPLSMNFPIKTF